MSHDGALPRITNESVALVGNHHSLSKDVESLMKDGDGRGEHMDPERAFVEYRGYVAAIGRKIIGADTDVDDVVQDVFLMVHRDLHRLRNPEALRYWLATITERSAHRSLRQRVADREFGIHDPAAMENAPDAARSPELEVDVSSSLERLRHLPERLRQLWLLKHVQEWSLESIARECCCSPSTVQRRLRHADAAMCDRPELARAVRR